MFYICVVFYDPLGFGGRVNNANAGLDTGASLDQYFHADTRLWRVYQI